MAQMTMIDKLRALTGLGRAGMFNPGARLMAPKQGTGKRLTPKEREKLRKLREKEERRQRREMKANREGTPPDAPRPGGPGR
jgi:signal recognition particle subunit SRP54